MAGSVQRQKVYVQVTDWRLFGEGIASGLDYARKPRESPPNNSALCSHPRPGPVDDLLYLPVRFSPLTQVSGPQRGADRCRPEAPDRGRGFRRRAPSTGRPDENVSAPGAPPSAGWLRPPGRRSTPWGRGQPVLRIGVTSTLIASLGR